MGSEMCIRDSPPTMPAFRTTYPVYPAYHTSTRSHNAHPATPSPAPPITPTYQAYRTNLEIYGPQPIRSGTALMIETLLSRMPPFLLTRKDVIAARAEVETPERPASPFAGPSPAAYGWAEGSGAAAAAAPLESQETPSLLPSVTLIPAAYSWAEGLVAAATFAAAPGRAPCSNDPWPADPFVLFRRHIATEESQGRTSVSAFESLRLDDPRTMESAGCDADLSPAATLPDAPTRPMAFRNEHVDIYGPPRRPERTYPLTLREHIFTPGSWSFQREIGLPESQPAPAPSVPEAQGSESSTHGVFTPQTSTEAASSVVEESRVETGADIAARDGFADDEGEEDRGKGQDGMTRSQRNRGSVRLKKLLGLSIRDRY